SEHKDSAERRDKIRKHSASRAPETGPMEYSGGRRSRRQDFDDIDDFTGGDWRQFFRSEMPDRPERYSRQNKEKKKKR
ncbi:MAG: hypothetical protein MJY65_06695, partial [Bacteroidaceae bacterium]|nr:hypothetical protein [Bacteroidaceae bacterium]